MTFLNLSRRSYAFLATLGTSTHHRFRSPAVLNPVELPAFSFLQPGNNNLPKSTLTNNRQQRLFSSSSSSSSLSFQAPEPPSSKGKAVFPDVDISSSSASSQISKAAEQRNNDPDAVFVVNGASRGIGLQMVQSLLLRTKGTIIAACRVPNDPESALNKYLETLSPADSVRIDKAWLDLEDQSSIDALESFLKTRHNKRVDGLFNVAGILGDGENTPGPERSLARMEREWMEHSLAVNVVGHGMLIKALRTMLKSNNARRKDGTPRPTSVVVNLSARVGSISDNELGGWYSYRLSKAALNQATRTMAHELKRQGTYAIAVHPGTTDTDLSKPFQRNVKPEKLFPVDFTVNQILDVVDHVQEEHSGGLYDWAGKAIPF